MTGHSLSMSPDEVLALRKAKRRSAPPIFMNTAPCHDRDYLNKAGLNFLRHGFSVYEKLDESGEVVGLLGSTWHLRKGVLEMFPSVRFGNAYHPHNRIEPPSARGTAA